MKRFNYYSHVKKSKAVALVCTLGFLMVGTMTIWGGILAVNSLGLWTTQAIQSTIAKDSIEKIKTEIKGLPKLQSVDCLGEAQSLFAVQPWLDRHPLVNLKNLKTACFKENSASCSGLACETEQNFIDTTERKFI